MITRLGNIQVGKGHYLYKTGRRIWRTKSEGPTNGSEKSGRAHRLVKGNKEARTINRS